MKHEVSFSRNSLILMNMMLKAIDAIIDNGMKLKVASWTFGILATSFRNHFLW